MRVGLELRLRAVERAVQSRNPLEYAVHNLCPKLRRYYDDWVRECADIAATYGDTPGARYAALCDGHDTTPPMPDAVQHALWPNGRTNHHIPHDATTAEAARIYADYIEGN